MKKILLIFFAALPFCQICAQEVKLDSAGRDAKYVEIIISRSQKIVDGLNLKCAKAENQTKPCCQRKVLSIRNIICNRYFQLNDIYEKFKKGTPECDAELYKHHFELQSALAAYLTDEQIDAVKDGMTFGRLKRDYQATLDMIPTLTEEEKLQVLIWLREAREFALDAPDSKGKHFWFDKYRGRTNNWLSARGYDLQKERDQWIQRHKEKQKN
jgi:hypothetical protein